MTNLTHTVRFALALSAFVLAGTAVLKAEENATSASVTNQPALAKTPKKLKELPPGNHRLLETMTKNFGLTYDQQLEIEPILHDEESVSKPILGFAAFTPEEKQAMLLTIKHAARRQIRPLLTPEQQQELDKEDAGLAARGAKKGGGKKSGAPKKPAPASTEESLTSAIRQYEALSAGEKETMIAQVTKAAHRPVDSQPAPSAVSQP
jgi:Spy/CpxP family protein refolding chaperone